MAVQPSTVDLQYTRRLNEMLAAQAARQRQQQEHQQLQQLEQRRRLDLDSIPILQLPGRQQKQQKQQQPQTEPIRPAVDWRQVVEHVRRTGQTVTGQQMLTDTFR